jgi:hypothetical protein
MIIGSREGRVKGGHLHLHRHLKTESPGYSVAPAPEGASRDSRNRAMSLAR